MTHIDKVIAKSLLAFFQDFIVYRVTANLPDLSDNKILDCAALRNIPKPIIQEVQSKAHDFRTKQMLLPPGPESRSADVWLF